MKIKYLLLLTGLSFGNFTYQWVTTQDWTIAFERSFFQAIALIAAYLII